MPLNATLVVVGGEVKTAEIKLRLPSTIGRGRGATIMLPHPLVSRQHCELFEASGRLMVRDLGSLNGTFINNERISEAALPAGELLTVGAVTFRAVYDAADSSGPPAGPAPQMKTATVRDTDPNGTVRAPTSKKPLPASAPAASPPAAFEEAAEVEFNFDEPLTPVDEGARITTPVSPQTDATLEGLAIEPQIVPEPAANTGATVKRPPMPSKPPPAPAAAQPVKQDQAKADFAKWEQEDEEVHPAAADDDDFGDFLKSLGAK